MKSYLKPLLIALSISILTSPLHAAGKKNVALDQMISELRISMATHLRLWSTIKYHSKGHDEKLLKLIEDEYLFRKFAPKPNPEREEEFITTLERGISEKELKQAVRAIKMHQSIPPSRILRDIGELDYSFMQCDPDTLLDWSMIIPLLAERREFQDYMEKMRTSIAQLSKENG